MRLLAFLSSSSLVALAACAEAPPSDGGNDENAGSGGGSGGSATAGAGASGKAGSATAGAGKAGSAGVSGSSSAGAATAGSGTAGTGAGTAGAATAGSATAGSATAGSATAGSATAGSATAGASGSGTAGGAGGAKSIATIASGNRHTCAATTDGQAYCWGSNDKQQVDASGGTCLVELGPNGPEPVPCVVSASNGAGASGVVELALGDAHTCARTAAGAVSCWGDDGDGQLGDGKAGGTRGNAVAVATLPPVVAIGAGALSTCALDAGGFVYCWGANSSAQLGNGTKAPSAAPTAALLSPVVAKALAVGAYHACVVTTTGGAQCWGQNLYGQLGDGTKTESPSPTTVKGLAQVDAICAGGWHTCALSGGKVSCWGSNTEGQLGSGTLGFGNDVGTPTEVPGLSGVQAIACGREHTCALAGGAVSCWGSNTHGELGAAKGASTTTPTSFPKPGVDAVSPGGAHTCVRVGTQAFCAGWNAFGQLGAGTSDEGGTGVAAVTFLARPSPPSRATQPAERGEQHRAERASGAVR